MFRNNDESRPIISLGRRSDPYTLCSDSEDDFEEIEFDKAVFERRYKYEYEPSRKTIKRRCLLLCLLFTTFIGILGSVLYYYFSRQVMQMERRMEDSELNVKTSGGFVRGVLEDDVFVFKGIPYAKPPQRWQPPSRCSWNDCWRETFQASEFGKRCSQARFNKTRGDIEAIGSENCLFVNVWTLSTASEKKLPVVVYLHGGGLLSSSGDENGLHPTPELIKDMEIVGVSLNYRLDAFGFLALDILSDSSVKNTSGNYGFMDQIMALRWVHENIAQFGGDPEKVTIFGQGSGGTSVLAMLASPLAKGFFQQAVALSPSADITKTSSEAAKDNEILLTNANCTGNDSMKLQCLHALSPLQILKASPWNAYRYKYQKDDSRDFPTKGIFPDAVAVIDGYVMPSSPATAIRSNDFNDVPLILGNVAQEIDDRPKKHFQTFKQFKDYAKRKLLPFLGNNLSTFEDIFDSYKMETSNKSAQYFYTTMVSDIREVCPVEYLSVTAAKYFTSPVFRYVATSTPSHGIHLPKGNPQYSFHIWDLLAFYDFPRPFKYKPSERDTKFKRDLRTEFNHFLHNGKVKSHAWLKHSKTTAVFSNKGLEIISKIYHKKKCKFWLINGFASYAWAN